MPAHNARFGVRRGDVQAESPVGHFPSERQAAGRYLQAGRQRVRTMKRKVGE